MHEIGLRGDTDLGRIVAQTMSFWPDHAKMLRNGFASLSPHAIAHAERNAELVAKLANGDLTRLLDGYKWMCTMITEEELYFRRNGRYRNSSFEEVNKAVYQTEGLMQLYMDGLLLSQVLWPNHILAGEFYVDSFLADTKPGAKHLEVGPGHGLLLYQAARLPQVREAFGWDISPVSLERTGGCLDRLGVGGDVKLQIADILAPGEHRRRFDNIVLSEVAEHLEEPVLALRELTAMLEPDGRLFINVPVNAPTVDHIFLLRSPEEALELVESAGLRIEKSRFAPASGYTLERARKSKATITCTIIARRA